MPQLRPNCESSGRNHCACPSGCCFCDYRAQPTIDYTYERYFTVPIEWQSSAITDEVWRGFAGYQGLEDDGSEEVKD